MQCRTIGTPNIERWNDGQGWKLWDCNRLQVSDYTFKNVISNVAFQ